MQGSNGTRTKHDSKTYVHYQIKTTMPVNYQCKSYQCKNLFQRSDFLTKNVYITVYQILCLCTLSGKANSSVVQKME